ncbi:hypothetical protein D3C87_1095370 [compost metagenome]
MQRTGAGNGAAIGVGVPALEGQHPAVDDVAADAAGRPPVADLQHAALDGRAAGMGGVACQDERARVLLDQPPDAMDRTSQRQICAGVAERAVALEHHIATDGHGGRGVERAAVESEPARRRTEVGVVENLQHAAVDRRAARVGVETGKHQSACIRLHQLGRAVQAGRDGGGIGYAQRRPVADANDRLRVGQLQRAARQQVAVGRELHALGRHLAQAVVDRDHSGRSGEDGEGAVIECGVQIAGGFGPVVVAGVILPQARAAADDAVELGSGVTVPEAEIRPARQQIDLASDRRLDDARAAGQRAEVEAVVDQGAGVVDDAIDAGAEDAALRLGHVQHPVEGQVALDLDQVVQASARRSSLTELHGQGRVRAEQKTPVDRQRADGADFTRRQGSIGDVDAAADGSPAPQGRARGHPRQPCGRRLVAIDDQGAGIDEGRPGIAVVPGQSGDARADLPQHARTRDQPIVAVGV